MSEDDFLWPPESFEDNADPALAQKLQHTVDIIFAQFRRLQSSAGGVGIHDILSDTHTDTVVAAAATGDLLRRTSAGKWERLGIGIAGQALIDVLGLPAWSNDGHSLLIDAGNVDQGLLPTARYPHNLLSTPHTDTTAAAAVRGDIVLAQAASTADLDAYWIDGGPFDEIPTVTNAGDELYWVDGGPIDGLETAGAVTWQRKANSPTAGYVWTAGATGPDWQPSGGASGNTFASVYKAAAFVLSDNTLTDVILDTVETDPLAFWSAGTPTRLTVPVAQGGLYLIEAEATWPTGFVGMMYVHIYVNGVKRASSPSSGGAGSNEQPQLASALVQLNSGDFVVATLQHIANAAGTSATIVGGVTKTRLQLGRLASESVVKSDLPSAVAGNLIQGNPTATGYDRLPIGAAGRVLLTDGAAASWSTRPTLRDVAESVSGVWGFDANFKQYGRATRSMEKIAVAYAAGNFTGNGAMTWGVAVADQLEFLYAMDGKFMFVTGYFNQTTVGGVANTDLQVVIPGGFVADGLVVGIARVNPAGAGFAAGTVYVTVGGTTINFQTITGANWTLGVDNTAIQFSLAFPVQ